jgi:uncharacterized protein with HEPN domain
VRAARNERVYLTDILDAILKIEEYARGLSYEDFFDRTEKQDAIVRRLEIIGEATKRLSDELKARYA